MGSYNFIEGTEGELCRQPPIRPAQVAVQVPVLALAQALAQALAGGYSGSFACRPFCPPLPRSRLSPLQGFPEGIQTFLPGGRRPAGRKIANVGETTHCRVEEGLD
jgi:hypothetical protein